MGGVVGRLFREFAVTVTLTIAVSVVVSLTLTPMLCARFLRNGHARGHSRLYEASRARLRPHARRLPSRPGRGHCAISSPRCACSSPTVEAVTAALVRRSFPGASSRSRTRATSPASPRRSCRDASYAAMVPRMLKLADVVRQDPDIAGFNASTRARAGANTGSFNLALKDKNARRARRARTRSSPATAPEDLSAVEGVSLFLQAAQDVRIEVGAPRAAQYQYTFDRFGHRRSSTHVGAAAAGQVQGDAGTRRRRVGPAERRRLRGADDRPRPRGPQLRHHAGHDRLVDALRCGRPAPGRPVLHAGQHLPRGAGGGAQALQSDPALFSKIFINSPITGRPVPLSTFVSIDGHQQDRLPVHQPPGPISRCDAVVQPRARESRSAEAVGRESTA